jgi:hypothetical protein
LGYYKSIILKAFCFFSIKINNFKTFFDFCTRSMGRRKLGTVEGFYR